MSVSTAVPNGYSVASGSWRAYTGSTDYTMAASAVAAVSDSSNNTYVRATALSGPSAAVVYDMTNPTLGGSALTRMRVTATMKNGDGGPVFLSVLAGTTSTDTYISQALFYPTGTTAVSFASGWLARSTAFSQTTGNAAQAQIWTASTAVRITAVRVEYDLASLPLGTPAVSSVTTMRPTVTWAYSDADGYVQSSAVVKLFSAAQYGSASFNASTSTPLWVGTVIGTSTTITPGSAVITSNALSYKPFLQVFKNIDQTVIPSAFTSATSVSVSSFTLPAAPTATATWSSTLNRVMFQSVGLTSPYRIIQFRGTAVGTASDPNFVVLKDSTQTDGTATFYDYYMPRGTAVVYGAYVTSGTQIPYVESLVSYSTVTVGSVTTWEMRSVDSPATYYNLAVPVTGINFDIYEGQTVFRPLGSTYPIVAAGDIGGDDGTMQITTTNQTTWESIKTMLELQSNLFLIGPFVDSTNQPRKWFIRVTGRSWTESGIPSAQVRIAQVSFVEVQPPTAAAE